MTSNETRAAALVRVLRAAIDGDERTIFELCTEDLRAWTPAQAASSRDEVISGLADRDEYLSYAEAEVVPLDVGGPYAAAEWTVTLTREAADAGLGETEPGALVLHGAAVAEFRHEKICALRLYWDEGAVLQQLGPAATTA